MAAIVLGDEAEEEEEEEECVNHWRQIVIQEEE